MPKNSKNHSPKSKKEPAFFNGESESKRIKSKRFKDMPNAIAYKDWDFNKK